MSLLHEYWWLIVVAAIAIAVAFLVLRPRQRVRLSENAPARPHMAYARPREGRGLTGEAAAAASDVTGELIGAAVRRNLAGFAEAGDDLCMIKGVGPKFADVLHGLGFFRFEQIGHLTPTEIERLDRQLGAFSGRITRDRIVEQADYLARGDVDGFEHRFGKL